MIISRTPLRISFAGGGTDLKAFYEKEPGCVVSTSTNKYVYVNIHPFFEKKQIQIKYSSTETVNNVDQIKHPLFREALKITGVTGVEIATLADIPAGTGLGSSSTFTVGLLHALYAFQGKFVSAERLAREASKIEIDVLGEPIGKQDHYAAAYGNLNFIEFNSDGAVSVKPIACPKSVKQTLQNNLLLFYTGMTRSASEILKQQRENTLNKTEAFENLLRMKLLVQEMKDSLYESDLSNFGEILHKGWMLKKKMAGGISNSTLDQYYDKAKTLGALGGKVLGAGGGGFLLLYCDEEKQDKLRNELGLREVPFSFDREGSRIIHVGD